MPSGRGSLTASEVAFPKVGTERMGWNGKVEALEQLVHPQED